ncbi:MAG: efflux RND transporter permease subunit [Myxococcales bacterium]|nr:efflux RND transporter permease subunit [Myxococcales bacterium]MCB9754900.1 efflux RND transporter permease subunit [Myxococcales bacterium]
MTPDEDVLSDTSGDASGQRGLLWLAIRRPVSVLCCVLLVVLFGALSTLQLPIQLTPDIAVPTLTITTAWPGAAPTEVEMEILEEQEDVLKSVPGLEIMKSEARADQGQITLEFEVGTSIEEALVRVSNRLSQVPRYPDAAREPVIATSNNAGPPLAVITIRAADRSNVDAYRTWVDKQILPQLERIRGVSGIRLIGGRDQELHIDFDPAALAARGLTIDALARAVQGELRDVSGGDFTLGKRRLLVRTPIAPDEPAELARVVLGADASGTPILLGDVADVSIGLRKRTAMAMSDDRPSLVLLMWREAGTNVLEVTEDIKAKVRELDEQRFAPEGLEFRLISDQVGYINSALALVRQNLVLGGALAIIVLLLFLRSVGASLLIGVSIPVCVVGTMLGMSALGRTVNVVSLAGMAFAVGMVVDNAIVVLESIDSWRARVDSPAMAAYLGVREVFGAILASTLTTAIVFVPVITWQDEVGELLRDIAVAISMAVGFSLLVSVLAIPSFAARVLRPRAGDESRDALTRAGAGVRRLIGRQAAFVSRSWPRALVLVTLGVALTGALAVRYLPPMEYLPTGNRNLVFGILVPPPGYSVDEMERVGEVVQGEMAKHQGRPGDPAPAIARSFYVGDPNQVFMGAVAEREEEIKDVLSFYRETEAKVPGMFSVATQASLFGRNIGGGRAVEVEVSGTDLGEIIGAGGKLLGAIREAIPGAQIRPIPSLDLGAPEVHAVPRRDESAALGVGGAELGLAVDALVDGAIVGEYGREGEPKIDVVIRAVDSDGRQLDTPEALASAPVATRAGELVPVSRLVKLQERAGPTLIQRIERRRAITLQVSPPETLALEDAMRRIRVVLEGLRADAALPDSVDVTLSGTAGQLEGAKTRFAQVLVLALVISYLLLAALFEDFLAPIAVLVTVPLAAAGGVLGLRLVDATLGPQPLDMMTAMGFLILLGVVVNNAILVVDGALARLRAGAPLAAAVRDAVEGRVRPIFMSSLTSLAGLLPLVLFPGSGSELYRGVGAVVLGGLALSTVLTLYMTPSLFTLLWRARGVR